MALGIVEVPRPLMNAALTLVTGALLAPLALSVSYLAATQSRDGNIQLVSSRNHYVFNLAWVKDPAPAPKK